MTEIVVEMEVAVEQKKEVCHPEGMTEDIIAQT